LLVWSSLTALRRGELDSARARALEAVKVARKLGDDRLLGAALHARAQPDKHGPDLAGARAALREAMLVRRRAGDTAGAAMSIGALADIDLNRGDFAAAAEGYALGLPLMRASGSARGLLAYLHSMAELEVLRGDPPRADELVAEARLLATRTQDVWHLGLLAVVAASAARDRGAPAEEQRALARAALRACAEQTDPVVTLDGLDAVAGMLLDQGDPTAAHRLLRGTSMVRAASRVPTSTPRRARRDADEAAAAPRVPLPDTAAAPDVDWLLDLAANALR
jgi:hypothetical protein